MAAVSSAEREMNLSALQQRDPYITGIADSASQVAVYSFNSNIHEWEKTNVEGTLFVYSRSANPVNGFMIINRLHLNDLVEPINRNLEFQLQDPFLLYRNEKACIYGIWFYDRDECARIGQLMNSLVQIAIETQQKESASGRQRRASESDTTSETRLSEAGKGIDGVQKNVDILQMLSKAQDEYDKSKAQILRKSSTPTVTTNGNCVAAVGGCDTSPVSKMLSKAQDEYDKVKRSNSGKCADQTSSKLDNLNAGSSKPVKVLRPTAVKPAPLQMETSKQGPDPITTPNTQISLEALFKRAVLQQDGSRPANAYRVQPIGVQMVPTVAQLMSSQTGTTTVEELERQQQNNACLSEMAKPEPSLASLVNGPASAFSRSISTYGESESPNTMLRRTLNLGPSSAVEAAPLPPQQAPVSQNCEISLLQNSAINGLKTNVGADQKLIINAKGTPNQIQTSASEMVNMQSPLNIQSPLSTAAGLPSSSSTSVPPGPSAVVGPASMSSMWFNSNNYRHVGQAATAFSGSTWSSSPHSDVLAPPETFQTTAVKNDGANILLSPMVFKASTGVTALNQSKLSEPSLADLLNSTAGNHHKSPVAMFGEPPASPVSPLTRDQLQQALIHLLKNDSGFLSAVHEAYVASLNHELSGKTMRP